MSPYKKFFLKTAIPVAAFVCVGLAAMVFFKIRLDERFIENFGDITFFATLLVFPVAFSDRWVYVLDVKKYEGKWVTSAHVNQATIIQCVYFLICCILFALEIMVFNEEPTFSTEYRRNRAGIIALVIFVVYRLVLTPSTWGGKFNDTHVTIGRGPVRRVIPWSAIRQIHVTITPNHELAVPMKASFFLAHKKRTIKFDCGANARKAYAFLTSLLQVAEERSIPITYTSQPRPSLFNTTTSR